MSKKPQSRAASAAYRTQRLFCISLLCSVITLLGGACALLLNGSSSITPFKSATRPAYADQVRFADLSIAGSPTLSAATVNAIFARLGSPMAGTGAAIEQVSQQTQVDDAFALGVWWTETNDGETGVGLAYHNPGGVRGSSGYPSGSGGYTIYPNYTDAIVYWFHMLRNLYVDRGLTTVYAISHPYVGTASSPLWAGKVVSLMLGYRGEAPPPTPVPTLMPSPTYSPFLPHHRPAYGTGLQAGTNYATAAVQAGPSQPGAQGAFADSAQPATTTLPIAATWSIVLAALLLALAIALGSARFLPAAGLSDAHLPDDHAPPRLTGELMPLQGWETKAPYVGVRASPPWLQLPSVPPPPPSPIPVFASLPETPGTQGATKIRRTILLPSRPGAEAAAQSRPAGLLARYGQRQQE